MAANHGPFIWYEYTTADTARASDFYGSVMNWTVGDIGLPGMEYFVLQAPDGGVGGLVPLSMGGRPGWVGVVQVANVDETVRAFEALGGKVIVPGTDIPEIGRYAVLTDPDGALISVMTPRSDEQWKHESMARPGHAGWHELFARDGQKAFDFYSKVFGWTKSTAMDMGPMGTYQLFAQDGQDIGGMMTMTPQMPAPMWNFYFQVEAVDAAASRATAKGASLINGPHQVPGGGWVVQFADPEGQLFSVLSANR